MIREGGLVPEYRSIPFLNQWLAEVVSNTRGL